MRKIMMNLWLTVAFFGAFTQMAQAGPTVWKFQAAFPGPVWESEINKLAAMIEEGSKGNLTLQILPAESVISAPKLLDGISHKVIEMGGSASIYYAGKVPETNLINAIPFLYDNTDQMIENIYDYKDGALMKLIQEVFKERNNVRYLAYGLTSSGGLFGTFKVASVNDIKGKKIRVTGMSSALIREMGGSPVNLPGSEHYTAFQRGTIDGTVFPLRALKDYRLAEVAKYYVSPAFFPGNEFGLYCNIDAYNSLSPDLRTTLDKVCVDWGRRVMTHDMIKLDQEALAWAEKQGVQKSVLPSNEIKSLRTIVVEKILPEYRDKTPQCKKIWDIIGSYAKEKGLI